MTTNQIPPSGARRRRPLLLTVTAAGAVVGLLGVAGVFATSSDRATTGQNDARSGVIAQPPARVDIQLATATFDPDTQKVTCHDDWAEDLTTGLVTSDGSTLGDQPSPVVVDSTLSDGGFACLRNVGDEAADVTVTATDVVDTEIGCSPGEAEAGDETCGSGVGELSSHLHAWVFTSGQSFDSDCYQTPDSGPLSSLAAQPSPLARLEPGAVVPVCPAVAWLDQDAQAQSDLVTWHYAFDAVTAADPEPEPGCVEDEVEAFGGDTADDAFLISPPVSGPLTLCSGDDDWFEFVSTGQPLQVTIDGFGGSGSEDLDLYLYVRDEIGSGYTPLDASTGTTNREIVLVPGDPGQRYLVKVTGYAGAEAPYMLTIGGQDA